jgi:hypothetical protein
MISLSTTGPSARAPPARSKKAKARPLCIEAVGLIVLLLMIELAIFACQKFPLLLEIGSGILSGWQIYVYTGKMSRGPELSGGECHNAESSPP